MKEDFLSTRQWRDAAFISQRPQAVDTKGISFNASFR